jgi:hypothetical protein
MLRSQHIKLAPTLPVGAHSLECTSCVPAIASQVAKYERVNIDEQGRFKFTGQLGLPSNLLQGQIIAAPCDAGQCRVRKDTTLMPPCYATAVRMRTANRPVLFVWHWLGAQHVN